jgi:hypothetical protein
MLILNIHNLCKVCDTNAAYWEKFWIVYY